MWGGVLPLFIALTVAPRRVVVVRNSRINDTSAYTAADNTILQAPGTRVFVAYGQSNADCCGTPGYTVKHPTKVLQFYIGNLYQMKEPMLGAYCEGGCMWSRAGDMLVENDAKQGIDTTVVVALAAYPGQLIVNLLPTTAIGSYFASTLAQLPTTATVLFQHGESDALDNTDWWTYKDMLQIIITTANRPFLVGVGTRCVSAPDPHIRNVQLSFNNGPDLDDLVDAYRRDGCHFSTLGLGEAAARWVAAIPATATPASTRTASTPASTVAISTVAPPLATVPPAVSNKAIAIIVGIVLCVLCAAVFVCWATTIPPRSTAAPTSALFL